MTKKVAKPIPVRVLYTKEGSKFVPARAEFSHAGWSQGFYLVHIYPNGSSTARAVVPDIIELECAYKLLGEELVKGLHKASEAKLSKFDQDNCEEAWNAVKVHMGDKMPRYFTYQSIHDTVNEAFKIFLEKYKAFKATKLKEPKGTNIDL